ncbi:MAG: hypothetical protein LAO55_12780 [Acidobacteriia bacterium]|nr:hypothetical protein [Terriglobia bacterium]
MSFPDRFELLELLHEGEVQTFRARERVTGLALEAHLFASPELLAQLDHLSEPQRSLVIDRGSHEGKLYAVTMPLPAGFRAWLAAEPLPGGQAPLDSAGAWRIRPSGQPAPAPSEPAAAPGDFTRMFQLRQAPEPVAAPALKAAPSPAASFQPGEFTQAFPRVFERPAPAPSAAPTSSPAPGQPGEFTRMFQKPAAPPATTPAATPPAALTAETPIPETSGSATPARRRARFIVIAVVLLSAIAVFVLVRTLY